MWRLFYTVRNVNWYTRCCPLNGGVRYREAILYTCTCIHVPLDTFHTCISEPVTDNTSEPQGDTHIPLWGSGLLAPPTATPPALPSLVEYTTVTDSLEK